MDEDKAEATTETGTYFSQQGVDKLIAEAVQAAMAGAEKEISRLKDDVAYNRRMWNDYAKKFYTRIEERRKAITVLKQNAIRNGWTFETENEGLTTGKDHGKPVREQVVRVYAGSHFYSEFVGMDGQDSAFERAYNRAVFAQAVEEATKKGGR